MCTFRLLLLLAVSLAPECAALPLVATPPRRAALTAAATAVLTRPVPRCWAATLEEEDDAEVGCYYRGGRNCAQCRIMA